MMASLAYPMPAQKNNIPRTLHKLGVCGGGYAAGAFFFGYKYRRINAYFEAVSLLVNMSLLAS